MAIQSINPATGEVIREYTPLAADAVEARLALSGRAWREYRNSPMPLRTMWMRKLAGILEQEKEDFATLIATEMGKPLKAARDEVAKCALTCRFYAENAERILAEENIRTEARKSYVRYEPLGVVLAIMPWNFPFWQVFRFAAPALMAGNAALLKHASNVPQCAQEIESVVRRAGFPRGVFQTLLIGSDAVEPVLGDPRVAAVTLTGSEAAGRAVAAQAGYLIKKTVLELGGSDPFIVMPSANLDAAVAAAVQARTINNGQSCIAAKRFFIHDDIYMDFTEKFIAGMEALQVGDPLHETTDIGPLATVAVLEQVEAQVKTAIEAGAKLLSGGQRLVGVGNFYEPTVLSVPTEADVHKAPIFSEEFFGPVAQLYRVDNLEHAIDLANASGFGLGAAAGTRDPDEQRICVEQMEAGVVAINALVASDPRMPFGGIKRSGYGRELSAVGMREFMNIKSVVMG
jgi:succinate-semialdehyde dehydrogenase/glutarate-semialdehyde dehydrogenase